MTIPVYETYAGITDIIKTTTGQVVYGRYGIAAKPSKVQLRFRVYNSGREGMTGTTPVNLRKLDRDQQLAYIADNRDKDGAYLTTKAYDLARELGVL